MEESRKILDSFIEGKKTFALEYNGKVIGSLGIEKYKESDFPEYAPLHGRELGYVLSKDYWGQGLMPEAVKAVISYLFESLNLDFIMISHFVWNRQSARVIEKCGLKFLKEISCQTRYDTEESAKVHILFR